MSLVELAIGFVLSRPYCAAVIFGARTLSQYLEARTASRTELSEDVLMEIELVHRSFPNPAVIGAMEVSNASTP
jgi:aryl-alcohol dehydrogenase-like predicted oxidoreductase